MYPPKYLILPQDDSPHVYSITSSTNKQQKNKFTSDLQRLRNNYTTRKNTKTCKYEHLLAQNVCKEYENVASRPTYSSVHTETDIKPCP